MLGKKIVKGSVIGLITPSSICDLKKLDKAMENLEKMGYKVKLGKNVGKRWHSFGGTDLERAEDLNNMFKDNEVDGILCIRGGYGSIRFLDYIDYNLIQENPKLLIGYSDITSLHQALYKKCNLVTLHGPMAVSNFSEEINEITKNHFIKSIEGLCDKNLLGNIPFEVLVKGECEGILVGGNLTTLVSHIGGEYEIDYKDKILFIEDIGENTYKIDRMLCQLKNRGVLNKLKGVIIGDFSYCEKGGEDHMSLEEVFYNYFNNLKKPVIFNVKSGHCEPMLTLPFGVKIKINTDEKKIELLENYIK